MFVCFDGSISYILYCCMCVRQSVCPIGWLTWLALNTVCVCTSGSVYRDVTTTEFNPLILKCTILMALGTNCIKWVPNIIPCLQISMENINIDIRIKIGRCIP